MKKVLIEDHQKKSWKNRTTTEKTRECRYLNTDTVQTMKANDLFKFKGICHASKKKEKRFVLVTYCP